MTRTEEPRGNTGAAGSADATLQALLDSLPVAVVALDPEGNVVLWSREAERIFGWKADEVLGKPYPLAPGDQDREHRALLAESFEEGRRHNGLEAVRTRKDGSAVDVELWNTPLRDAEGRIYRSIGVITDISARKRAEREYQSLFENAHDAIMIIDPEDEVVLEANPRACEMYGYERDAFVGRSLIPISRDSGRGRRKIAETLRAGSAIEFETVQYRSDGTEMHLEVNASCIEYKGRRAILSINRDATERIRLEEQVRHSQRMDAMGRLAGGVAHDLNNILTSVFGCIELLQGGIHRRSELHEYLDELRESASRASALTRQLLMFSRKQPAEPRVIDVNQLVRDLRRMLERLLEENIELKVDLAPSLGCVKADPGQLEQVLLNLVVNARDAMPDGGELIIRTANATAGELAAASDVPAAGGDCVRIEVRDEGVGIPPSALPRIFEPFFTTKPRGQGTGLGLSTVYGIVKHSGGFVDVRTETGRGTAVSCFLPVAELLGDERDGETGDEQAFAGQEVILLVEDEPSVLDILRRSLSGGGYRVHGAKSADQACRLFARYADEVDILVTDVVLPDRSGFELVESFRRQRPDLAVLVISGYLDDVGDVTAVSRDGFLTKPFKPRELMERIREILDRRAAARPGSNPPDAQPS